MSDYEPLQSDPIWDTAWTWVQRQHEGQTSSSALNDELIEWLKASPAHRAAYEKASHLWLLAGLVPPANDVDPVDGTKPDDE